MFTLGFCKMAGPVSKALGRGRKDLRSSAAREILNTRKRLRTKGVTHETFKTNVLNSAKRPVLRMTVPKKGRAKNVTSASHPFLTAGGLYLGTKKGK